MSHSALIIFAKLPRAGDVKTRLGQSIGMEKAVEVYKQFAEHAFTLADELSARGVRIYIFYAPGATKNAIAAWVGRPFCFIEQEGQTLGDRMRNAFDTTFAEGAVQTVIIGTDVPELHAAVIAEAFLLLQRHDVVVGPSTDGGYYLLGMKNPTKHLFEGIVWSTGSVLADTVRLLQAQNLTHSLLKELQDVDTLADFEEYLMRKERRMPSK